MVKDKSGRLTITEHFKLLKDPRIERTKKHSLHDILVLTICAVIGGADDWTEVERFAHAKLKWFKSFLDLRNGIPSHDTLGRVFAALDTEALMRCFVEWVSSLTKVAVGDVVAIDGKTLRGSFDTASKKAAIHMVSAWATKQHLVLGQIKTEEKSNEITAIPRLLDLLDVSGCIVTIDAMGCQREIAKKIVEKGADYVLSLKGNHETVHEEVRTFFEWARREKFKDVAHDYFESTDGNHGRIEIRRYWISPEIGWFTDTNRWSGLRSFGMVESERIVGEKTSVEQRYFLCSLPGDSAKQFAGAVRQHWSVENNLHWVLDVAFREDQSRVRKDHAPENFAILRHIALNLLKQETTISSLKGRRHVAGWNDNYLLKVLGVIDSFTLKPSRIVATSLGKN